MRVPDHTVKLASDSGFFDIVLNFTDVFCLFWFARQGSIVNSGPRAQPEACARGPESTIPET